MTTWFERNTNKSISDPIMLNYKEHHAQIEKGEFWFDVIKNIRSDAQKRLKLALKELPSPAAFEEAAKALRSMIREKKEK